MNRKYNSTSLLIRSPKLRFQSTPKRLSDVTNSKLGNGLIENREVHIAQILCNVEDVFKKSPVNKSRQVLDLTRSPSPCYLSTSYHRTCEGSYLEDSNESINSKIPFIVDEIHELTLGPNAIVHDNMKNDAVTSHPATNNVKSKAPCQDPEVSSEDSSLDENIRIYLKHECLETPRSDVPQHILEATNKFNHQQKKEYLDSRKSIEQSVISDQLRAHSQYVPEAHVSGDTLSILERNNTARQGILNTLNELKMKMVKKKEKESEEQRKIQKEKEEQLAAICKVVTESFSRFRAKEEIFLNNLQFCSDIARFKREGQELINFNSKVLTELNTLVNRCGQASVTRADVAQLSRLMGGSQDCFDQLARIHESIEAEASRARQEADVRAAAAPGTVLSNSIEIINLEDSTNEESGNDTLNEIIDPSSLEFYRKTSSFYHSVESQLESLLQDTSLKSYRFQCMKAFNIPINAISGLDGKHTLDQYNRLVSVLRGDKTLGTGSTRVSQHPLGVLFCKYSMAKKFVAQVDVKPRVLFAYASVVVELWREFPDFGNLLLGEFHKQCPYLIPVFWPQLKGQSNEEYYKSLGYEYIDGQVEKQDLFLKRMTAMAQLYAAVTVTPPRPTPGSQPHPHPHCLAFSWRWLAAMLNLEPQPDVSATLLYSYLKIAGNKMAAVYKTQFFKLIHFIQVHYLRKIKQVTPEDQSQQSIAILEEFINKTVKTKHVPPPEGQLPPKFW